MSLGLAADAEDWEHLEFSIPPKLPVEEVFGPAPPPQDWAVPGSLAVEAMRLAAAEEDEEGAQRALDGAYKAFVEVLEKSWLRQLARRL